MPSLTTLVLAAVGLSYLYAFGATAWACWALWHNRPHAQFQYHRGEIWTRLQALHETRMHKGRLQMGQPRGSRRGQGKWQQRVLRTVQEAGGVLTTRQVGIRCGRPSPDLAIRGVLHRLVQQGYITRVAYNRYSAGAAGAEAPKQAPRRNRLANPHRAVIEALLTQGVPQYKIALAYGVGQDNLQRAMRRWEHEAQTQGQQGTTEESSHA